MFACLTNEQARPSLKYLLPLAAIGSAYLERWCGARDLHPVDNEHPDDDPVGSEEFRARFGIRIRRSKRRFQIDNSFSAARILPLSRFASALDALEPEFPGLFTQ